MSTLGPDQPSSTPANGDGTPPRGDTPYELEPDAKRAVGGAADGKASGKAPMLDAQGLIDDFDEDADFDAPGSPGAMPSKGEPTAAPSAPGGALGVPFIKPGIVPIRMMLAITGLVVLLSVVVAVRAGAAPWYAEILLAVYHTALHSVAGVLAVVFAARMASREVGAAEVAFVRMMFAVALTRTLFMLDIPIPFTDRVDELLLSVAGYGLSVGVLFRLSKRDWQVVVGTQFVLSMVLIVGASIETWHASVTPAPSAPPAAAPATTAGASR